MILIESFLKEALYDWSKLVWVYLNDGDKVRECYANSLLINVREFKMQVFLHVDFFKTFLINYVLLKQSYLYMKQLQSITIF